MAPTRALEFMVMMSPWLRAKIKEGTDCLCGKCAFCAYLTLKAGYPTAPPVQLKENKGYRLLSEPIQKVII